MSIGSTETDRKVLVQFYRSANGKNWHFRDGWDNNNLDLGSWSGVKTTDEGRVVKLHINNNNLQGAIPPELGGLSTLKTLELAELHLSGAIPRELGGLSALKTLQLVACYLSGAIPPELGGLSALKELNLTSNQLSGAIPPELGGLSALETLHLCSNQLSGAIPPELGGLSALKGLDLAENRLSGAIPPELGGLSALKTLRLIGNRLSGAIPPELGGLSALTLDLEGNRLSDLGDVQYALELVSKFDNDGHTYGPDREKELRLRGNPWKMPPEAVVEQGLKAIKIYLGDVQKASENGAQVRSLKLLKVVLVGASSAGKTSLMRSIINEASSPTEGTLYEASTVGIELSPYLLQGTKVEFYDCAGQVDYAGMHQTFLSRRALYLLVWDVKLFRGLDERYLKKDVYTNIMRWLYTIHLRAPGATVILVANKCDTSLGDYAETTGKVERLVKHLLNEWQSRRSSNHRSRRDESVVRLLDGVSPTSCANYGGIGALVQRISGEGATSIQVPPAWDLALKVLDALRAGGNPLRTARKHLELNEERAALCETIKGANNTLTTKKELLELWGDIVRNVSVELQSAGNMAAVSNWEHAFNGALWISEFAGQILRIDSGEGIFLDVVWLSKVLSPILSHKLHSEDFPTNDLKYQRDSLVHRGVLLWDLAQHLWRDVLTSAEHGSKDRVIESLFHVLLKLGVILPLGRPAFLSDRRGSDTSHGDGESKDMLVIARLPEKCSDKQQDAIDSSVLNVRRDCREVKLKWEFDAAQAPYGLVERLISSCHVIGEVEQDVCWRYGALFTSHQMTWEDSREVRLYKFLISYDNCMLSLRMIGPLSDDRVLYALRYVASAMVVLSMEWPGVQWEGWLDCPNHPQARVYLTPPGQARIGGQLLGQQASSAHIIRCDCQREANGVLQLVRHRLGTVVDTREGRLFEMLEKEDIAPEEPQCCRERSNVKWPRTWQTARALGTLVVLFCSAIIAGIVEEKDILWITCLRVVVFLLVAALGVSVLATVT